MNFEHSAFDDSPEKHSFTERLGQLAEIVISTSRLVEILKSDRDATTKEETYHFAANQYPSLVLPEIVNDWLLTRELVGVNLTLGREDITQPSWMTIIFECDDGSAIYISRAGTGENASEPDVALLKEKEPQDIPKVPKYEINRFMSSLIEMDRLGDYSDFDFVDLHLPSSFDYLTARFNAVAPFIDTHEAYVADDESGSLSYITQGGELIGIHLTHGTANKNRKIAANINCERGIDLNFYAIENGLKLPLMPDDGDILLFRELIDEAIEAYGTVIPEATPDIETTAYELSETALPGSLIHRELDEDGLDSTDAGRA